MDKIDEKIKELLAEAKLLMAKKQVPDTIHKLKLVLQLDPENEEAIYVLEKLKTVTGNPTIPQKKLVIISNEQELTSELKVLFNGIEIGQLKDGLFQFTLKNGGKVEFRNGSIYEQVKVDKNQSSIINLKINNTNNQLIITQTDSEDIDALLLLSSGYIEKQNYNLAIAIIEQILAFDSTNSKSYFQLLLIDLGLTNINQLNDLSILIDDNDYFKKALLNADDLFRSELMFYATKTKENIYTSALVEIQDEKYEIALSKLEALKNYKDAVQKSRHLKELVEKIRIETIYNDAIDLFNKDDYAKSLVQFESLNDYKDTLKYIKIIQDLERKEKIYQSGIIKEDSPSLDTIEYSINVLLSLGDYKNSESLISEYKSRLNELIEQNDQLKIRKQKMKNVFRVGIWIFAPVILLFVAFLIINSTIIVPTRKYNDAMNLIESGRYNDAKSILLDIENFSDSKTQFTIIDAHIAFENNNIEEAVILLEEIGIDVDIEYNLDGGTISSLTYSSAVLLSLIDRNPYKEGYTFDGWELVSYLIDNTKKNYSANVYVKAIYLLSQYTITFEVNGGKQMNSIEYNLDSSIINLPVASKQGYTFKGWYDNPEFAGDPITEVFPESLSDLRLYALWEINQYTISFNSNGGSPISSIKQDFNTPVSEPLNPIKTDYVFGGWYSDSLFSTQYDFSTMPSENLTLNAKWIYKYYTINYDPDGGELPSSSQQVEYGQSYSLLVPTRENYVFLGWYLSDILIEDGIWKRISDVTLVAKWDTIYTYTIKDNEATITGFKYQNYYTTINFPEEIFGLPVVEIGSNIGISENTTNITVPNSVKLIGYGAFSGASSLKSITLPFVGNSRTATTNSGFGHVFGGSDYSNDFYSVLAYQKGGYYSIPKSLKYVFIFDSTRIPEASFFDLEYIEHIIFPENLISIKSYAFDGCNRLISVFIPITVTSIGFRAFANCNSLTIYAETISEPESWDSYWNPSYRPVIWGY